MNAIIFDDSGSYDLFTITEVQCPAAHLQHNMSDFNHQYDSGSQIAQINNHTYYLDAQAAQLMHYDGTQNPDIPVVDHVVGFNFDYYGDPQAPQLLDPLTLKTSYGPKPPPMLKQTTAYPAGENCTFMVQGGTQVPRLATLGAGGSNLVKLTAAQLGAPVNGDATTGAWCPDVNSPNRYNANLLRIRKIVVTIRVESAVTALRGPASTLFTNAGTSRSSTRWLPDQEVRFQVTPRNLNLGR